MLNEKKKKKITDIFIRNGMCRVCRNERICGLRVSLLYRSRV